MASKDTKGNIENGLHEPYPAPSNLGIQKGDTEDSIQVEGTGASSTSKHAEGLHSNMYKPTSTNGKDVDHARATEKGHAAMMHMSSSHLYQLHMGNLSGCYPKGKGVGDDFQVHPFFPDPQQLFAHPANLPYFQNADVCPKGQMAPAFPYNQADWTHYQQLFMPPAASHFFMQKFNRPIGHGPSASHTKAHENDDMPPLPPSKMPHATDEHATEAAPWSFDSFSGIDKEHFASIGFPSLPERGSFGLTDDFRGYLLGREERKKECQGAMEGQAIHPKNMSAFVNLKEITPLAPGALHQDTKKRGSRPGPVGERAKASKQGQDGAAAPLDAHAPDARVAPVTSAPPPPTSMPPQAPTRMPDAPHASGSQARKPRKHAKAPAPTARDATAAAPGAEAPAKPLVCPLASTKSGKTPRQRQKHVRVACIHCKRAHLACDNCRPCKRCVRLGRTDCVDVVHKRRGRPKSNPDAKKATTAERAKAMVTPAHTGGYGPRVKMPAMKAAGLPSSMLAHANAALMESLSGVKKPDPLPAFLFPPGEQGHGLLPPADYMGAAFLPQGFVHTGDLRPADAYASDPKPDIAIAPKAVDAAPKKDE